MAYGVSKSLSIQLYDVESAYFNAQLDEEIYVKDPIFTGHRAWRLKKALYGLKQSAKVWNDLLKYLFNLTGFSPIFSDPAIFKAWRTALGNHEIGLCCSIVDDLLCALEPSSIGAFEKAFETQVKLEHKGYPILYLEMELYWGPKGILILGSRCWKCTICITRWKCTLCITHTRSFALLDTTIGFIITRLTYSANSRTDGSQICSQICSSLQSVSNNIYITWHIYG